MHLHATIEKISYTPTLCTPLTAIQMNEFISGKAFEHATFLLDYHGSPIAVSQWISPKRTRSYPYARVYDTMNHSKRVTIIPFVKDEGKDGDRDFLQWDTVSLMSLLGVYVIIAYYKSAGKSLREKQKDRDKITNQEFDYKYLKSKLDELDTFKSDALHWNLLQLDSVEDVAERAKECYLNISRETNVQLHRIEGMDKRIAILKKEAESFKKFSRAMATAAQEREYQTIQPKENISARKAKITINNYLGGEYHLTIDELVLNEKRAFIVEKKHSEYSGIPSMEDIKDGALKMILFVNLKDVMIDGKKFEHSPVLGLTSNKISEFETNFSYRGNDERMLSICKEGLKNNFYVLFSKKENQIDMDIQKLMDRKHEKNANRK